MFGGLLKSASSLAIIAAAGIFVGGVGLTPAKAADLGGDCCADLEERVAELEATTVRKGNRKVSVTLYGWVNQAVTWYDNGEESDVYVHDNGHGDSRLGVKGEGKVRPGLAIGYKLEMGFSRNEGFLLTENDGDNAQNIRVRQEYWYIKDDQLGQLSVGHQYPGSAGTGAVEMGGASSWESYSLGPTDDIPESFRLYHSGSNGAVYSPIIWYDVLPNLDPGRQAVIKYTTPTIMGFTASASWGEDDRWDVGLLYSNTFNTVSVSAGVGYYEDTDNGDGNIGIQHVIGPAGTDINTAAVFANKKQGEQVFSASFGLAESSSGLYGEINYYNYQQDITNIDGTEWYGKIGWKKNVTGIGETDIYGEYMRGEDLVANNTNADVWGVGLGQDIDAVGATAYLSYRHFSADLGKLSCPVGTPPVTASCSIEDTDVVTAGMVVPF